MSKYHIRPNPPEGFSLHIRAVAKEFLACETKRVINGRYEVMHFPKQVIQKLMDTLKENHQYCNTITCNAIDAILIKECLWLDNYSTDKKFTELKCLINKLLSISDYWTEEATA